MVLWVVDSFLQSSVDIDPRLCLFLKDMLGFIDASFLLCWWCPLLEVKVGPNHCFILCSMAGWVYARTIECLWNAETPAYPSCVTSLCAIFWMHTSRQELGTSLNVPWNYRMLPEIYLLSAAFSLCISRVTWWKLVARRELSQLWAGGVAQLRAGSLVGISAYLKLNWVESSPQRGVNQPQAKTEVQVFKWTPSNVFVLQSLSELPLNRHSWPCSGCKVKLLWHLLCFRLTCFSFLLVWVCTWAVTGVWLTHHNPWKPCKVHHMLLSKEEENET